MKKQIGPKILLLDIETSPILGYVWSLWDNNLGLNQVKDDWQILSWAAKWHDPAGKVNHPIQYEGQNKKPVEDNERKILSGMWNLLDEADIVIGHNSKKFDIKKLNARFAKHGLTPPSSYKQIDTLSIAKKHFAFTSNKLEYLAILLGCKLNKMTKRVFQGFELWTECLLGNKKAWKEMELYNKQDVLVLEEVYKKLIPWDNGINFNLYTENNETICSCGSISFLKRGFYYTNSGRFQRYRCNNCGKETRDKFNQFNKDKKESLKPGSR